MADFLSELLNNPVRAKLLRVFVFDESRAVSLPDIVKRSGLKAPALLREIKKLEQLDLVKLEKVSITLSNGSVKKISAGKQTAPAWILNPKFKHSRALSTFVHEVTPIKHDSILQALRRSGRISAVILSGAFMGDPTRPADLLVAVDTVNERRLEQVIRGLEPTFGREIRYAAFSTPEFRYRMTVQDRLIRETLDFPHLVLLDRTRLL